MKLVDGRISILVGEETTTIQIIDKKSCNTFVEVELTAEQFCQALSRIQRVNCTIDVHDLDKVGKTHENKEFEFKMPDYFDRYADDKHLLHVHAQSLMTDGWEADNYFGSQRSFFSRDGESWARCTIRRWT